MKPLNSIKWGILGPGKIAGKFAKDLLKVADAIPYAVASTQADRAISFAKEYHFQKHFDSYESMLADPALEVVYIATPHVFHHQNALMCLQAGKAVLCEKPFAMNLNQVEEMITLAKKKNVFLMEAMWTRFLPHFQYVLDIVQKQTFGKLLSLEADFGIDVPFDAHSRLYNKSLGGGGLLDVGIYPVFASLQFLGYPTAIQAHADFGTTGVDIRCEMLLKHSNKAESKLYCSTVKRTSTEAKLVFEKGSILMNSRFHEPSTVTISSAEGTKTIDFNYQTNGYYYEAAHLTDCLQKGLKESPLMNFESSRDLIKLLDAVRSNIGLKYEGD